MTTRRAGSHFPTAFARYRASVWSKVKAALTRVGRRLNGLVRDPFFHLAVGLTLLGLLILIISGALAATADPEDSARQWWVSVLIELGVAVFLAVALVLLGDLIARLSRASFAAFRTEVDRLDFGQADMVRQLRAVRETLPGETQEEIAARLDAEARARLDAPRLHHEQLFASVATSPSAATVRNALKVAIGDDLVAKAPRVQILYTDVHATFRLDGGELVVTVEDEDAGEVAAISWPDRNSWVDVGVQIGEALQGTVLWNGVDQFFPGQIPRQLSELLVFASEHRQDVIGHAAAYRVVEIVDDEWVITERGMFRRNQPTYFIHRSRYREQDWESHILGKRWRESGSFPHALRVARGLAGS